MNKQKHIHIFDDDVSVRVYLRTLLQREGYRVTEVTNPLSIRFRDPADDPDLVILDLGMPGLDGYAVCAELKADEAFKSPIVILSGHTDPESRKAALDAGADAYLTKPIHVEHLLGTISGLFSSGPPS